MSRLGRPALGFTLIEMLVAMAITLIMMGAVVTLFANISNSVRNRRATTEMSAQLRHVRNVLQQDLQGATCPGVTWQRSESNHGYIEIIEGPYREGNATNLIDLDPNDLQNTKPSVTNPEIDHTVSTLPSGDVKLFKDSTWATDGAALGDADDILLLTVRNEREPFNGRSPTNVRLNATGAEKFSVSSATSWGYETIESPMAEVVWFAVENPGHTDPTFADDPTANHFFGEPGYRTIYRRTLLIAPWLNPYRFIDKTGAVIDTFTYDGGSFKAQPGLLRILPRNTQLEDAIASVIAFQDRYDLSVRLEWDGDVQRWKIMANTLADLTKRENRFQHFGYRPVQTQGSAKPVGREFPFSFISAGSGYKNPTSNVQFATDPEVILTGLTPAKATAYMIGKSVAAYGVTVPGLGYQVRPFAFVNDDSTSMATAQAIVNDDGSVVQVVAGPVPLCGARRGQDVMMTDALAFDLRVYDPGAPVFATRKVPGSTTNLDLDVVLTPSDPGWRGLSPDGAGGAYFDKDHMKTDGSGLIGTGSTRFQYVGQGAYVDLGYGYAKNFLVDQSHVSGGTPFFPKPAYASGFASAADPWFFAPKAISDVYGTPLAPGYAVYDTWSFHYENNGIDEDKFWFDGTKWQAAPPAAQSWRQGVDQGTDGLDNNRILGVDDVNERETTPPYDKPLRGVQVLIRTYERDSRAIRQVKVNQHFMAE